MQIPEQNRLQHLANLTRDLESVDDNCRDNAYRDILSLAEQGDSRAMYQIARCLNQGIGVDRDAARADLWLLRACQAKPVCVHALFSLGMSHLLKRRQDADFLKGLECLERAASAGYVKAILQLVEVIERGGADIKPDLRRAYRLLGNSVSESSDRLLLDAYSSFVERNRPLNTLLDS